MKLRLPHIWEVPVLFTQRLGDTAGRQRAMLAEGHLLLVLHAPPVAGVPERTGRLFWRDPGGMWKSDCLGAGAQALKQHVAEFADRVDEFEKQWQTAATAEDFYNLLRSIAPLHRTVRHLHAALQQARELVPLDRDLINLRDQVGEIERAIDLLYGDAKNGLDFTVAHQTEKQAERSQEMTVAAHRLNVLAATFFPVATLSGFFGAAFGMMVAHQDWDHGWSSPTLFWCIMGLGLVSGLVLGSVIARVQRRVKRPVGKGEAIRR